MKAGKIAQALSERAETFCRVTFPNGRCSGHYWHVGNVAGDKGQSLAIRLSASSGRVAGKWVDFATGEYGDLIDLIQLNGGYSLPEALEEAHHFLGCSTVETPPTSPAGLSSPHLSNAQKRGRKLFKAGQSWQDSPVEAYLHERGIYRFGEALAYHPSVYYRDDDRLCKAPALLGAITDNDGRITGCARTFLDIKHHRLAAINEPKRVLGRLYSNAVRFYHRMDFTDLIVGEGLETILSLGTVLPLTALAACLTATHLSLFDPPSHIRRLWIASDNDAAGKWAASRLRERLIGSGIEIHDLIPHHNDFNDDLCLDGFHNLRRRMKTVMP